MKEVNLADCEWNKQRKALYIRSDLIGMPNSFSVVSERTGNKITFNVVTPDDPLFDEDGWDGEQKIYRPNVDVPTVEFAVIFNFY